MGTVCPISVLIRKVSLFIQGSRVNLLKTLEFRQLSSMEVAEREWACRSVAHMLCETDAQQTLLDHQGLPRSLIALLLDPEWSVRDAAAGALRSVS